MIAPTPESLAPKLRSLSVGLSLVRSWSCGKSTSGLSFELFVANSCVKSGASKNIW